MMRLQIIQKPPVVFTKYEPAKVIDHSELASALGSRRSNTVRRLWLDYGRAVLADVDPCMEANEGAAATIACMSRYKSLSKMEVIHLHGSNYELKVGDTSLYLSETDEGEVFLYFFSPERSFTRREECRIDLTDFGSDAAAYFIATVFESYESIHMYGKQE